MIHQAGVGCKPWLDRVLIKNMSDVASRTGLPARRMLSAMNGQHHDLVALRSKIDGVREPRQHCATSLVVNTVEHEGGRGDSVDEVFDRQAEFVPESGPARFVPCLHVARVVCGLGPKDNLPDCLLRQ